MEIENLIYLILSAIASFTIAVFYYYKNLKNKEKVSYVLTFLRFLSIFSILLLLINPKIEQSIRAVVKPTLVVAVDNSSSINDTDQSDNVLKLVESFKTNNALNKKFKIEYYSFANDVKVLDLSLIHI